MLATPSRFAFALRHPFESRITNKGLLSLTLATALASGSTLVAPFAALAGSGVEFDMARAVECRDITPRERLALYPTQRLIEVELPISVRFNETSTDDVDEIDIEVSGAAAG